MNTAVAKQEEKSPKVTYNVAGQDITLTYKIIRDYLTKGNGQVSDQDLMQFVTLCFIGIYLSVGIFAVYRKAL